ncbi:hypothetical protein BDV28DRAFT_122003 [Aspergillus coremiiformis]|uniref:DUF676 domain-containing protein n=1 Tax=Aspergillus coremiiformis TaxID=138285 RepID=A0A5N6ZF03_9EURO|nr:hypothetical protein BDV28DRAFT_122003 [Aspergillus coremiiformis]
MHYLLCITLLQSHRVRQLCRFHHDSYISISRRLSRSQYCSACSSLSLNCHIGKSQDMSTLSTTVHPTDSDGIIDVIAVRGIGSTSSATWKPLDPAHWGYLEWFRSSSYPVRISEYEYPLIDGEKDLFTPTGFRRESANLLSCVDKLRNGNESKIIFIGHDIGGILIKEALTQAAALSGDIYWDTSAVIFIGCPHVQSHSPGLGDSILRLLKPVNVLCDKAKATLAAGLSATIPEVNRYFEENKLPMLATVINTFSENEDIEEQIFNESETKISCAAGNYALQDPRPSSHRALSRHIEDEVCYNMNGLFWRTHSCRLPYLDVWP